MTREIINGVYSNLDGKISICGGICECECYCCEGGMECDFCTALLRRFKITNHGPGEYWTDATEAEFLEWLQDYKKNFQEMPIHDQRWREFIMEVLSSSAFYNRAKKVGESMNIFPASLEAFLEHIKECEKSNVEKSGGNAEILDDLREKNAEDLGVNLNEYRRFLKRVDVIKVSVNTDELLLLFLPPVIPEGVKKAYEREKKLGAKKSIYFGLLTSEEDELPLDEQKEIKKNMEDLGIFRRGNRFPFDVKRGGKVVFTVAGYEFATANTSTLPSPKVVNGLDGLEEYKGKCIKAFHARYTPEPHGSWLYFFFDEDGWHMGEKLVTDNKTVQEIEALYAFFCLEKKEIKNKKEMSV